MKMIKLLIILGKMFYLTNSKDPLTFYYDQNDKVYSKVPYTV